MWEEGLEDKGSEEETDDSEMTDDDDFSMLDDVESDTDDEPTENTPAPIEDGEDDADPFGDNGDEECLGLTIDNNNDLYCAGETYALGDSNAGGRHFK